MKIKKPVKIVLIALVSAVAVCFSILALPWAILATGYLLSPDPPKPEKEYGEFPFELVYELNGETHTVDGIFVCKYDGMSFDEGQGKHRTWTGYVEGTDDYSVCLFENEEVAIHCYIGDAGYYMNDSNYSGHPANTPLQPCLFCIPKNKDDIENFSESDILEKYKIKLLEWKLSEPIDNSFE